MPGRLQYSYIWSIAIYTIATVVWIEGLSDLVACRFLLAC